MHASPAAALHGTFTARAHGGRRVARGGHPDAQPLIPEPGHGQVFLGIGEHAGARRVHRASSSTSTGSPTRRSPSWRSSRCSTSCWRARRRSSRVDTAAILLLDDETPGARRARRQGPRGGGRARRADPGRRGLRRPHRGRPQADLHRRRRPRRDPQPDPAHEGRALAARRPAARRGRHPRRAARRHGHAARVHQRTTRRCCSSPPPRRRRRSTARGCSTPSIASIAARSPCSAACCPTASPTSSASTTAARYLPARDEVGGDWYDVIDLPAGQVGLGDRRRRRPRAAGGGAHGPAARRPARLRARRPLARRDAQAPGPHAADDLRAAGWPPPATRSSIPRRAPCATRARATRRRCSSAAAARRTCWRSRAAPPLGSLPFAAFHEAQDTLAPGDTILLYTDGLIERRREPLTAGPRAPARAGRGAGQRRAALPARRRAARAARREATTTSRSSPCASRRSRRTSARALRRRPAGPVADAPDARPLAAGARRASPTRSPPSRSPAARRAPTRSSTPMLPAWPTSSSRRCTTDGLVTLTVRDTGRWRPPRGTNRGRGLKIIAAAVDELDVRTTDAGTEVVMRRALAAAVSRWPTSRSRRSTASSSRAWRARSTCPTPATSARRSPRRVPSDARGPRARPRAPSSTSTARGSTSSSTCASASRAAASRSGSPSRPTRRSPRRSSTPACSARSAPPTTVRDAIADLEDVTRARR